jgi:formyltetrahydrofolate deformylase
MPIAQQFVLTLACRDTKGIVHAVSGLLYQAGCNIIDSQQFGDLDGDDATGLFFMRVHFRGAAAPGRAGHAGHAVRAHAPAVRHDRCASMRWPSAAACAADGQPARPLPERPAVPLEERLSWRWTSRPSSPTTAPTRRWRPATASPSTTCRCRRAASAATKRAQEQQIEALIERERIDLVVLARYMQILSPEFCDALKGRAINIHHSFLPSFKGARPYFQAHARGVKLIGATAHYVTADLDEGPIIEQDVSGWTTRCRPTTSPPWAATSNAWCWPAPCAGTSSTAC